MVEEVIQLLGWRFTPWADEFSKLYFDNFASDYADVRSGVATQVMLLDNVHVSAPLRCRKSFGKGSDVNIALQWHPSYPSVVEFVQDCIDRPDADILDNHPSFTKQMDHFVKLLPELRKDRPSGPKAALSEYDKTALTGEQSD
jgi:hypothetical protein